MYLINILLELITRKKRFTRLISHLKTIEKYRNDWWLQRFNDESNNNQLKQIIKELNLVFSKINKDSWGIYKCKLIDKFNEVKNDRGKSQFFNEVNEAYAYNYLIKKGYTNIKFIKEMRKSTPDLQYSFKGKIRNCEVKTYNISDIEIERIKSNESYDSHKAYSELNENFFMKLKNIINKANEQIEYKGCIMIYIKFDDFTLSYQKTYIKQISNWFENNINNVEIYIFSRNKLNPIISICN